MKSGKKVFISGVMTALLAMGVATPALAAETANPTSSTIYVDGQEIAFEAYNINGNNYFKLRDVAWALSGTDAQFNVTWDDEEQVINLISGEDYGKNGSLSVGNGKVKSATLNSAPIMKDGSYVDMTAYNIEGNNFFKLRDLGVQFGFQIGWNGDANAVTIDTDGIADELKENQTGVQTFTEGATHNEAKAGDVVKTKDGKTVTIQATTFENGHTLLGVGTGVDYITGTKLSSGYVLKDGATAEDGTRYMKCPVTNECHSADQWNDIRNFTDPNGKIKGDYDGETYMGYWKWNANATQHFTNVQGRWDWQGPHAVS